MRFGIKTLDDVELKGKCVLCRVDINQPVDTVSGKLKNTARIEASVPTIRELKEKGAKVVLMAHQGSDIEYQNFYTTRPHAEALSKFLGSEVKFIDDVCGPAARDAIKKLKEGEILLLDNVRFCSEEQTLFEMKLKLSQEEQARTQVVTKLAPLGDLYVCDAFAASHRDQPSLCGFEYILPSAMGRLFEKEYCIVSELMEEPQHPCIFVLGGSKVSDAFMMMSTVLESNNADKILTGGLVANIMLYAKGEKIGSGSVDYIFRKNFSDLILIAKDLIDNYSDRIVIPTDLAWKDADGGRCEAHLDQIPEDVTVMDIGSETACFYSKVIATAATIFVNGPMGVFEEKPTEYGTKKVWEALGNADGFTIVGGGDSITATAKYGQTDNIDYICTGGGALIRMLSGIELPVVKALRYGAGL